MLDKEQRLRMMALAGVGELQVERTDEGIMVAGFIPEWNELADLGQHNWQTMVDMLKMSPVTSNVTTAAFRQGLVLGWQNVDGDAHLFLDNKGMSWYLFLSPNASEADIGSNALSARMKIIQSLMSAENANDVPHVGS